MQDDVLVVMVMAVDKRENNAVYQSAKVGAQRERFDALSNRIAAAYVEVPEEQGLKEIDAAVASLRSPKRKP